MKHKKSLILVTISIIYSLVLVGCSNQETSKEEKVNSQEVVQEENKIEDITTENKSEEKQEVKTDEWKTEGVGFASTITGTGNTNKFKLANSTGKDITQLKFRIIYMNEKMNKVTELENVYDVNIGHLKEGESYKTEELEFTAPPIEQTYSSVVMDVIGYK